MKETVQKCVIVIPAFEPPPTLEQYVRDLKEEGFRSIVVVDDGSGADSLSLFDGISHEAVVLRHEENQGKGAALKTAFRWIEDHSVVCTRILTADADGQHTAKDCLRLAENSSFGKTLYLGTRNFALPGIPARSRFGNRTTSSLFKLLYGTYLPDTQTGLRAFDRELLPFMMRISGERYEYEMHVLIACIKANIPILSVPAATIYKDPDTDSHFRPVRDSWCVCKVLFKNLYSARTLHR